MEAIEALQTRNSSPRLGGQVSESQIGEILKSGFRAPDHGQLKPWRVLVIEGTSRSKLGRLFVQAKKTSDPNQSSEQLAKAESKAQRAPVILVVAASIVEHASIPEIEQLLAAGAAAQNILVAAHALGLGAIWRTGEMAYSAVVHKGLGMADNEKIIGFIYVGEVEGRTKSLPALKLDDFVTRWK